MGDTESGHCQGACHSQWFFYVPLQVSETAPPFYVVMRAMRDTVSNVEGREINLHRPIPCAQGIEPGAATWQAHTLPLALLQPNCRQCSSGCKIADGCDASLIAGNVHTHDTALIATIVMYCSPWSSVGTYHHNGIRLRVNSEVRACPSSLGA